MSDRQICPTEEASPDIYISATSLHTRSLTDNTSKLSEIPSNSNSTTYTAEEFRDSENVEDFIKTNIVVTKTCSNVNENSTPQPLGSAQKRNVTSISDDEVHGSGRKNRRPSTAESMQVSSHESVSSENSGKIDSTDITSSPILMEPPTIRNPSQKRERVQDAKRMPEKNKLPCAVSPVKQTFPIKTEKIRSNEKADMNKLSPTKGGVDNITSSSTILESPSTNDPAEQQAQNIQEEKPTPLRSKIPRPIVRLKKLPIKKENRPPTEKSDGKKSSVLKDGVDNITSSPTLLGSPLTKEPSQQRGHVRDAAKRTSLRGKIPRLIPRLKQKLPIKDEESETVEKTDMKKSSTIIKDGVDNITSFPNLLESTSIKTTSEEESKMEGSECSVTESLPTLVNNSEDGNEKTPKRKPNTPVSSPSRARLTPTSVEKLKTHWRISGKKIAAKTTVNQKLQKRIIKPASMRPGFQESNPTRSGTRGSYVSTRQTINTLNKNIASEKKSNELNHSVLALKDQSHKLSILGARYRIQLKRFNTQSKDLLGLTIMLESTRKTLIILGEQITTLGGEVPPGDLEKFEPSPVSLNCNTSKTVGKTDKSTSPTVKEVIPDFVTKLQEENKALLAQIKKLQEENAAQVSWFCKNLNEMKILEDSSLLTDVQCKEALNRQSELGHKLKECDTAVKELLSLHKDANHFRANLSKLKYDLNEEKTKLEAERNSRCELENKLNQDLINERGKVKAERIKREALQSQLTKAINERNSVYQDKVAVIHQMKELEERLLHLEKVTDENNEKLQKMHQLLLEKEAIIKETEETVAELKEAKDLLETQILNSDAGNKSAHSSVVEMSKQLLNKDEQMAKIKSQRDQAFNENTALSELLHFLAALNCLDISMINFDEIMNDSNAMVEIKEKIKEACRKPNSTITESLVREQAEQIKEQAINIQKFREEINKQNGKIQELLTALNLKENEIMYLKEENCQQHEKLNVMETIQQNELSMAERNECETKDVSIDSGTKVTRDQLLTMLVAKSTALARMESKVKQLELVHSMCARRRARGESRIAQLESILQSDPSSWGNVISN